MNSVATTLTAYPSLSDRIQSVFIDTILIVAMMVAASSMLERFGETPDWVRAALFFGIWAVYEPLCTCLGCTVGQWFKGLRVRSMKQPEKRIGLGAAFFRYLTKMLLGWISFLTIHSNPQRRAIHDLVSGSVMLMKEK